MAKRDEALQAFVDAAFVAFNQLCNRADARRSIHKVFSALQNPGVERRTAGSRLPVCSYLDDALAVGNASGCLRQLIERFRAIEPSLEWRRRTTNDGSASANFDEGHANAMLLGPGGYEQRRDVWLGASLLAPNVRYPDHDHAPEEVYVVLSEGEFRQRSGEWFSPGVGGSFYNEQRIKHAMRSKATPLFAFWALWTNSSPSESPISTSSTVMPNQSL